MFSTKTLTAATAAFALISSSTADYNPKGKGNTAVYWGAGGYQLPLTSYCNDDSIDIIPIGFINSFPAQANGLVGVGMASNTCNNSPKYAGPGYGGPPNPANDEMWTDCSPLANALYECQQTTKTKFLLSLGGANGNYNLNTAADGVYLANLLWGMFGPYDPAWVASGGIRPFDVSSTKTIEFDGFDFDIETSPNNQAGYVAAIAQLQILFEAHNKKTGCNKKYLITGAPQCPFPDAHMSQMIDAAPFDIIWPQFYNNPGCSARNWVSNGATSGFNFGKWQTDLLTGASKNATLYIGLLGGEQGSTSFPGDYLNPTEAKNLLAAYASQPAFGGVMIWDAISSNGTDSPLTGYKYRDGTPIPATAAYYDVIKDLLGAYSTPYTAPASVCSTSSSSTTSSTKTSTTSSSTSTASSSTTTTSSSTTTTSSAAASTTSSSTSTSSSAPTTTGAPVHQPSATVDGITCVRIGCYTEGYNIRALTPYTTTDYALMSPEICAANCNVYPYAFIGVEYGGECYCGNQINNGSTIVADSECNMPCDGFPGEYCGAGDRLDMYQCGPAGTSSTSPASSTTSSTAPTTSSSSASSSTSSAAATTSTSSAVASSTSSSTSSAAASSKSSSTSSYPAASSSSSLTSSSAPAAQSSSTSSHPVLPSSLTVSSAPGSNTTSTSSTPSSPSSSTSSPAAPSSTVISAPGSYPSSSSSIPSYPSNSSVITGSPYPTTTTYPGGPASSTSSTLESTITETRTTTTVRTISSCAPTVTNCPYGQVLTDTIVLTTTYCPGNPTPSTSTAAAITTSPVQYTTSTVYRTTVYTVTSCVPTVTNCPAKIGQVTTETIIDYTTVCPVTAAETGASWSQTNTYYTWTTSSTTTQYVTVKVVPSTATLIPYPVSSPASVLTLNKGVASGTLPAVALYTTTAKPSQFTGAASSSRGPVAVVMAVVIGAVALLI